MTTNLSRWMKRPTAVAVLLTLLVLFGVLALSFTSRDAPSAPTTPPRVEHPGAVESRGGTCRWRPYGVFCSSTMTRRDPLRVPLSARQVGR